MSLEQTTELYASVLRQLLPEGVYDTAEMTHVADDIYAHAKALAQADIDSHRLLQVLETIPVDLLADYEREYGLPMQCMVPGSQTIEERISVLRWIRQHRNVMNREYLEQILAILDVALVDVVKHRPMLCTAPCTSPVNTEHLRYKVLLRLQYPMTANMSCIIENYLPGYLRVEWVVDMPWSEWILNSGYELVDDNIRYSAYKTNQRDFYDSYADFDLVTALIRSFRDSDMQQWKGVDQAVNSLSSNAINYSFNLVDEIVNIPYPVNSPDLDAVAEIITSRYMVSPLNFKGLESFINIIEKIGWEIDEGGKVNKRDTGGSFGINTSYSGCSMVGRYPSYGAITAAYAACGHPVQNCTSTVNSYGWTVYTCGSTRFINYVTPTQIIQPVTEQELSSVLKEILKSRNLEIMSQLDQLIRDAYSYDPVTNYNELYNSVTVKKTFDQIARQIKTNLDSSNEIIVLNAQNYVNKVSSSIFEADESKQFLKYSELQAQFELNKLLRN